MGIRRWRLPPPDAGTAQLLQEQSGLPELVCRILAARGITDREGLAQFFCGEESLADPFLIKDMDKAVERLQQAIEEEEHIAVYGDYDCDGITSTALLTSYLQSVGADVFYYVPSREREGYGLNTGAVDELHRQGVTLIVTVDNGISAHEEIAHANALGIDVVVTDHHTPRESLPQAVAVVNPHREDCPSEFKGLAGVGVAFKLICALEGELGGELLEYYSDLAAIGTIADIVPLIGENRVIVRHGLSRLTDSDRPGVAALLEAAGLSGKALSSESVAFGLAPRINAAGRMDRADDALELLLTDDPVYAREVAGELNSQNEQRKKIEDDILAEAEGILAVKPQILNGRVLVLCGKGWHHGVVGIVAARLVERYGKPTILFSEENGVARGSGRSIEGFSLIEAITACSGKLTQYGGHVLAAGLSLKAEDLEAFEQELQEYARLHYAGMPVPVCSVDCILQPEQLSIPAIGQLSRLEPFGCANEAPLFLLPGLKIEGLYPTNDKKHLRIRFSGPKGSFYAVYFRMTRQELPCSEGEKADVLAALSVGEYNGSPQLSVRIKDLRPAGLDQEAMIAGQEQYRCHIRGEYGQGYCLPEELCPTREDLAVVYRYLRGCDRFTGGAEGLYYRLFAGGIGYGRMLAALDVLEEMGLIVRERGPSSGIAVVNGAPKVDLGQSAVLRSLQGQKAPDMGT